MTAALITLAIYIPLGVWAVITEARSAHRARCAITRRLEWEAAP